MSCPTTRSPHSRIRLLEDSTVHFIAAGEVVTSIISCFKELVENSIDSGAKNIDVSCSWDGIVVNDDGCGMTKEDLLLCTQRYATSKILPDSTDLTHLETLGFRGEALGSIASVSRCTIHSSTHAETGHQLFFEGNELKEVIESPRSQGTTVVVKDLFFNIPVRRKFHSQKDRFALRQLAHGMALAHPHITLKVSLEGRVLIHAPSYCSLSEEEQIKERFRQVVGDDPRWTFFADANESHSFRGMISTQARKGIRGQLLVINQRVIHPQLLAPTLQEALGTKLEAGTHPLSACVVTLPKEEIDVNVHPQKREVKVRVDSQLFPYCRSVLRKVFFGASLSRLKELNRLLGSSPQQPDEVEAPRACCDGIPHLPPKTLSKTLAGGSVNVGSEAVPGVVSKVVPEVVPTKSDSAYFRTHIHILHVFGTHALFVPSPDPKWEKEKKKGIYLCNMETVWTRDHQHVERWLQPLIHPMILSYTESELDHLEDSLDSLEGFSLSRIAPTRLSIEAIPIHLEQEQAVAMIQQWIEQGTKPVVFKEVVQRAPSTERVNWVSYIWNRQDEIPGIIQWISNEEMETLFAKWCKRSV